MPNDYRIDPAIEDYIYQDGQFAVCGDLGNRIYLSLSIERGSLIGDETAGSNLHLLKRAKDTGNILRVAENYAMEALQHLLDDGSALSVTVEAAHRAPGYGINLAITVEQAQGSNVYQHFVPVG